VAGYGDQFSDFFTKSLTSRATQVSNLTGTDSFLAIAEQQTYVEGTFDFEGVPEKAARDDEPNLWVTSFSYQFRYEKPIAMEMSYPIVVHNQLLPSLYRPNTEAFSYQSQYKQFTFSNESLQPFTAMVQNLRNLGNRGLIIPPFDPIVLPTTPVATVRVFLALTLSSTDNTVFLMNLGDLPDFNLDDDILAFMKASETPYMTVPYNSIFQLHYFSDYLIQDQSGLKVDENLNIYLADPGDIRATYRVRLSLVANFTFLPTAAIARLRANPAVACKVLTAINAAIRDLGSAPDIRRSRLTPEELALFACMYDSTGRIVPGDAHLAYDMEKIIPGAMIETLFINTQRKPS